MKFFTRNTKEKVEPLPQDLYAVIDPRGNVIMSVNDTLSSLHWNAPGTKIGVYHLMYVRDLQINEPTLKEPEEKSQNWNGYKNPEDPKNWP